MQIKHNIIADSDNYITECASFDDFSYKDKSDKPKFLKTAEFLQSIKTKRNAKQRHICTTLDHEQFLALVKEKNLPILDIKYVVNGQKYYFELLVCNRTTPRSIYYSCYSDYAKIGIEEVNMPYYNDDYDIYRESNITLQLIFMREFYNLPNLKYKSKEEIEKMFE